MDIFYIKTKKEKKRFLAFKQRLYRGDPSYVDTASFVLEDVLFQQTAFTKACLVQPVLISDGKRELAECIFLHNPKLPYLQIAFFEAVENAQEAVALLLNHAKSYAKTLGLTQIVIGLNAHISYGVGILTDGFDYKNSFDSLYNKPYYKEYFKGLPAQSLSTYHSEKSVADKKLSPVSLQDKRFRIEQANVKHMERECERMRLLCEKTIARTFLYFPTEKGHFYDLMKDLLPFLTGENLLFAVDEQGNDVGFLFWHPDFNQMLNAGEKTSALKILFGYLFRRKNIETVKINAMGSLNPRATLLLLATFNRITGEKYKYVETNFVWDNNLPSTTLNGRFFDAPHRKYEVYFLHADD